MIKIYDTLSRKKKLIKSKKINIFVCGPTVYDYTHLGHLRTYLTFDALVKFLKFLKYQPYYLVNITDVDDKIINRAREAKTSPFVIAKKFEKIFFQELKRLKINSINKFARASEHIPQIINQIKILIKKGYAYQTIDGSVYFRTKKFKNYGKLSRQDISKLKDIEKNELKEDPLDFALWKGRNQNSDKYEPKWLSPWGYGRPGWHIEDTAISEKYFGVQYDIHGGGIDLIFPHHECEIAQQESASGKSPFVKVWMHTGLLFVNGEKMSKSLKNFITLNDFNRNYPLRFFRFFILSHHWQSTIDLNNKNLSEAWQKYFKLNEFVALLEKNKSHNSNTKPVKILSKKLLTALNDNFNTYLALNYLFEFINNYQNQINQLPTKELLLFLKQIDSFYNFIFPWQKLDKKILILIKKREILRIKKKFKLADKIRERLKNKFIYLEDTSQGPLIINLN
jgi:cysteinyl-tRNA synthetase